MTGGNFFIDVEYANGGLRHFKADFCTRQDQSDGILLVNRDDNNQVVLLCYSTIKRLTFTSRSEVAA